MLTLTETTPTLNGKERRSTSGEPISMASFPHDPRTAAAPTVLPAEDRHRLRSQLQTVRVGMSLIEKLLELGRPDEARETCQKIIGSVEQLALDPSLNPPQGE